MALTDITVEPLGRQHDRTAFHCGAQALDRYLKQQKDRKIGNLLSNLRRADRIRNTGSRAHPVWALAESKQP